MKSAPCRLPMPEGIELAAPQGYWFDNEGVMTPSDECHGTSKHQIFDKTIRIQFKIIYYYFFTENSIL